MNRVYKVIWSKAKHCYVVTSEIAKSYTKGESTGRGLKKLAAALLVAAALMGPNFAWAAGDTVTVKDTTEAEQIVYTQKGADDQFATKTDLAAKANAADVENTYAKTADVANTYVNKTDAQVTNLTVYRDVEAYGNLQVGNGNFTVSGITGNVTTGYATIGDDLTVKGDTEMKGDLSVKGTLNAADGKFSVGNDGQLSVSSGKFIVDTNGGINIGHGTATIDNNGNITGKKLDVGDTTVKSLDAGNGLIQTTGTVKAGDVQTGTLKAGATTVDSLDAGSGLIKTNGDISGTNITGTNITGDNVVVNDKLTTKNLAVTGGLEMNHITLGSEPTDNYTEINMGNVTSKNSKLSVDDGRTYTSTSNLTEKGRTDTAADGTTTNVSVMTAGGSDSTISSLADKNQKSYITQNMKNILQGIKNGTNESIINQTETGIKSIATDTDGKNNASTNLSNKGFNTFASDGGKNKTYTKQTAESLTSQIGDDGKVKSVMNADGITNNADGGTITNSAKDLVNKATGNMTNTVGGKLLNDVTGDMENKVGGNLTTTVTGDSSLTAVNITNEAKNKITNKAIDVETDATSSIVQKVTNDAGSNTSTQWSYQTKEEMSQADGKTASYLRGAVEEKSELIDGNVKTTIDTIAGQINTHITDGTNTSNDLQKADQIASSVTDGTNTTVVNQDARSLASSITDGTGTKVNNSIHWVDGSAQRIEVDDTHFYAETRTAEKAEEALKSGNTVIDIVKDTNTATVSSAVTDGATITGISQNAKDISLSAAGGTITNDAKDVLNKGTNSVINKVGDNKVAVKTDRVKVAYGSDTYTTWNDKGITSKTGGNMSNSATNITNSATEKLSNSAADIKNSATESITDKVGENVKRTMTTNKISESVKDDAKSNSFSKTAERDINIITDGTKTSTESQLADKVNTSLKEVDGAGNTTKSLNNVKTVSEDTTKMTDAASGEFSKRSQTVSQIQDKVGKTTVTTTDGLTKLTDEDHNHTTEMDYAHVTKDLSVERDTTLGKEGEHTNLTVNSKSEFKDTVKMDSTLEVDRTSKFNDKVTITQNGLAVTGGTTTDTLNVTGETRTGTLHVNGNGYVGGDLNVEGNIETHDAVLSADSRQVVTGRQLYQTNERVDRLDNRIKKVGANAAALAALRPGDFNPDDKFSIAAGFGSYRNANAAALGLFYRPNENVLLSLGTSFGDGENMVNAGVSVKFGRGKSMAERRKEMADEVSSMRDEMRSQDERIAELEEMLKKQSELIEKLSKES